MFSLLAFMFGGCVTSPTNAWPYCQEEYTVEGFAIYSESTVTFKAWDWTQERWEAVGSTTSSDEGFPFCPEGDMYEYSGTADFSSSEYWDRVGNDDYALLKVSEGAIDLTTFGSTGVSCMYNYVVIEDYSCLDAAAICADGDSPEITIICVGK